MVTGANEFTVYTMSQLILKCILALGNVTTTALREKYTNTKSERYLNIT